MTFKLSSLAKLTSLPTIIAAIGAVLTYLLARNFIDPDLAKLIAALIGILTGSAGTNVTTFNHMADKVQEKVDEANGVVR